MVFGRWICFVGWANKRVVESGNFEICSHIFCEMMIRNSLLIREDLDILHCLFQVNADMKMRVESFVVWCRIAEENIGNPEAILLVWLHDGSSPSLANQ